MEDMLIIDTPARAINLVLPAFILGVGRVLRSEDIMCVYIYTYYFLVQVRCFHRGSKSKVHGFPLYI